MSDPATVLTSGRWPPFMGRAFEDDPPFVWMLPDARTRQARTGRFFGTVMRTEALAYGAVEVATVAGVIVGGTVWYPPGRWSRRACSCGRCRASFARSAVGLVPAGSLEQALVRAHPRDRHWYLFAIGVDPVHQGSGVAGALLRSRLARCDQAREPPTWSRPSSPTCRSISTSASSRPHRWRCPTALRHHSHVARADDTGARLRHLRRSGGRPGEATRPFGKMV